MEKISNNLVLELHVPSFRSERDFFALFGFSQLKYDAASGDGKSGLGYMILKRKDALGETHLNFYGDKEAVSQHSYFKAFPADTPRAYGVEITIPVSDVEGLWGTTKDKLTLSQIAQPLTLKRWGKKDFRVVDPSGFYVRFTELVDWY
jgi:hypothetical protein